VSDWERLAPWWLDEVAGDPVYQEQVLPLAADLLTGTPGPVLDLGCGEGQLLRALERTDAVGCDLSMTLLRRAGRTHPVVQGRLPDLRWARTGAFGAAIAVLVIEHLPTLDLFAEAHRVVAPGGGLAVVMNHPAYTPPGAGPIVDQTDGEVLWRWGRYFEEVAGIQPAGEGEVVFYHRPLGTILTAAAEAGWGLRRLVEEGLAPATVARDPGFAGQEQMPRLLGLLWGRP
jgi:SAM-dependent methyltransferase